MNGNNREPLSLKQLERYYVIATLTIVFVFLGISFYIGSQNKLTTEIYSHTDKETTTITANVTDKNRVSFTTYTYCYYVTLSNGYKLNVPANEYRKFIIGESYEFEIETETRTSQSVKLLNFDETNINE